MITMSRYYWWSIILLCSGSLVGALFYQFALGHEPCELCIYIRVWLVGIMVAASFGLVLRSYYWPIILLLLFMVLLVVGLAKDVWVLLSIDHNWPLDGYCAIEPNFPSWARLDDLIPALFEVRSMCGPTPYLLFKISMADGLAAFCVALFVALLFGIFKRVSLR